MNNHKTYYSNLQYYYYTILNFGWILILSVLEKILKNVESVAFMELTSEDVIRHEVVRRIINAFDAFQNKEARKNV